MTSDEIKMLMPTEKFMSRVAVQDDGCWLWTGTIQRKRRGYGVFRVGGRGGTTIRAHRLSYLLFVGEIDDGLFVCHRCDVPRCVNPAHLFLGTNQENVDDCVSKKRNRPQTQHLKRTQAVSPEVANAIRLSSETNKNLASRYGVSKTLVHMIKNDQLAYLRK